MTLGSRTPTMTVGSAFRRTWCRVSAIGEECRNMQAGTKTLFIGVMLIIGAATMAAHHSWNTGFSEDKPLVLRGAISKEELVNPHAWIWIDVKGSDGAIQTWAVEGGPPNGLIRN